MLNLDKIKQVRIIIEKELMMTKIITGLFTLFGLIMIVLGFMFSFALVFLGLIYYVLAEIPKIH